ncbi:MAG: hypothetical protein WCO94_08335 [Verrucomicrobiota bacterium]
MKLILTSASNGTPTAEILTSLISENRTISAIFVFEYKHPTLLQQRLALTTDEKAIIEKAITLRSSSRLPFWESLMLSCFGEQRDFTRLLREATFHQTHRNSVFRISRDEILDGSLAELTKAQPDGHNLSFSSRIELADVGVKQLPLLDFHCPESAENDRLVSKVCSQLYQHTTLVFSSGESYHALGLGPLDESGLRDFLTRSLLFAPIVDARYVAHQLLEGACALRLSNSADKPNRPRLKFILG